MSDAVSVMFPTCLKAFGKQINGFVLGRLCVFICIYKQCVSFIADSTNNNIKWSRKSIKHQPDLIVKKRPKDDRRNKCFEGVRSIWVCYHLSESGGRDPSGAAKT